MHTQIHHKRGSVTQLRSALGSLTDSSIIDVNALTLPSLFTGLSEVLYRKPVLIESWFLLPFKHHILRHIDTITHKRMHGMCHTTTRHTPDICAACLHHVAYWNPYIVKQRPRLYRYEGMSALHGTSSPPFAFTKSLHNSRTSHYWNHAGLWNRTVLQLRKRQMWNWSIDVDHASIPIYMHTRWFTIVTSDIQEWLLMTGNIRCNAV